MSVFIQIGTNSGNDEFLQRVRKQQPNLVILIEPNKDWNETIRNNYKYVSGVIILNAAIVNKPTKEVSLFIPKVNAEGLAKNGVGYGTNNFSILPMDDWGEELVELKVPGITLSALCAKYDIETIDYLQIDTEGYDAEIIKSIDFTKINIKEIEFEWWHFEESCYTKYGEKAKDYGLNGMLEAERILINAGYQVSKSATDSMNRIAIKT